MLVMTRIFFGIKTTENVKIRNEGNVLVSVSLSSDESFEAFFATHTASAMLFLTKMRCDFQAFSNGGCPLPC